MPMVTEGNQTYPNWAELRRYEIHHLSIGEKLTLKWTEPRFKLVCVRGTVDVAAAAVLQENHSWDAPGESPHGGSVTVRASEPAALVSLEGVWGIETGGSGVFRVEYVDTPENRGDPVEYERETSFDNHYHDCDEYWIIVEGTGVAVSEGTAIEVGPGDCVITGAGDHHDFPTVTASVCAVYFETTLLGEKRTGHLWEHTHGPAHQIRR
jgi:mannose-6-phosphate isomerase-like protein (cupin superfamily)